MKHIKIFEEKVYQKRYYLKIGNHVKFIENEKPEDYKDLPIYKIIEVDEKSSVWGYRYKIEKEAPGGTYKYMWAKINDLLLIPEYEIQANKYNL